MKFKFFTFSMVLIVFCFSIDCSPTNAEDPSNLGIKDLLFKVEKEILEAQKQHEQQSTNPMFKLKKLQLKVMFQVKADAKGGIQIWVVEAGAGVEKATTHEITLELEPKYTVVLDQ